MYYQTRAVTESDNSLTEWRGMPSDERRAAVALMAYRAPEWALEEAARILLKARDAESGEGYSPGFR